MTVAGSGFGSTQGAGKLWLGSTLATIISWSDTQIVATVASNSTSGNAQVLQSGTWSTAVPFNVSTATISSVTPTGGLPGTLITIAGSGFGAAHGTGQIWLGTMPGVVQTWSDTQVVALVASGAATGNALVLQGGVMSNSVSFARKGNGEFEVEDRGDGGDRPRSGFWNLIGVAPVVSRATRRQAFRRGADSASGLVGQSTRSP